MLVVHTENGLLYKLKYCYLFADHLSVTTKITRTMPCLLILNASKKCVFAFSFTFHIAIWPLMRFVYVEIQETLDWNGQNTCRNCDLKAKLEWSPVIQIFSFLIERCWYYNHKLFSVECKLFKWSCKNCRTDGLLQTFLHQTLLRNNISLDRTQIIKIFLQKKRLLQFGRI